MYGTHILGQGVTVLSQGVQDAGQHFETPVSLFHRPQKVRDVTVGGWEESNVHSSLGSCKV